MKVGFIGGGNMAQALMVGLSARHADASFVVVEPAPQARDALARLVPRATVHPVASADLASCTAVVVAVKPQILREALTTAARWLVSGDEDGAGPLVVSIAAGIRTADIAHWLGAGHASRPIVRAMPNTPALIGAGITGLFAAPAVGPAGRDLAETLLAAVGQTLWVADEAMLDAVTAVSGSGPAYVFAFIEALERGAVELGLPPDDARRLAIATFVGASRLAEDSTDPVSVLRERVTSKGGTTAAALAHMTESDVTATIVAAVRKAAERSAELGDAFGADA
jgi:pyrroline-5-carboxylate reductase